VYLLPFTLHESGSGERLPLSWGGELNGLALCAGVGGLERGIKSVLPGSTTVCYVEGETYCASVLASKMEAGSLPKAPIWSNVRTFDGKPWREKVSFISGGFPCQPYSRAGKQLADKDPRDLWPDFARIIGEVRPHFIFLENVPNVVKWALPRVLKDLSQMGYDAAWCVVEASEVGAPHKRARWFLFAYANCERWSEVKSNLWSWKFNLKGCGDETEICNANGHGLGQYANEKGRQRIFGRGQLERDRPKNIGSIDTKTKLSYSNSKGAAGWWEVEPPMGRMVDGVADWVHRIRACGNGVVPHQAAYAYSILMKRCGF
jgi:DNA (cytosine-5)-methyltransferase 1